MVTMEGQKIPKMMSLTEAAEATGVSYYFLRKLCQEGRVVHIRSGRKYYINMDRLAEFLDTGEKNVQ